MTVKQLVNKILVGLRKNTLPANQTTITDSFELLLLQYLNVAKEEVEEAWDWEELRTTVTLTVTAGTAEYELTSEGATDVTVTNASRLLYDRRPPGREPMVFDVTDTSETRLYEKGWEHLETLHLQDDDEQNDPCYFALRKSSTGNVRILLWPTPSTARTLKLRFIVPQAELAADALDTELKVPARPVWMRALADAARERGEELGRSGANPDEEAAWALATKIGEQQNDSDVTGYPV